MKNTRAISASTLGGVVSNLLQRLRGARLSFEKLLICDAHIRVGREWLDIEEYQKKYMQQPSCDGAKRMPCADDTTPEECVKCKGGRSL